MGGTHLALVASGFVEVCVPRDQRPVRRQHANEHTKVTDLWSQPAGIGHEVGDEGGRPSSEGNVHDHGMKGMPPPGAVEKALERLALPPKWFVDLPHHLLDELSKGIQPALAADKAID